MDQSLSISFSNDAAQTTTPDRRFVHLEQIKEDGTRKTVTMYDLRQMVYRARWGVSARTYKPPDCPAAIEGNSIVSWFDFYSWPSSLTLQHTITSSLGSVSAPQIIEKAVSFSVTFELSDVVEFDFMLSHISSWVWETPCIDADGKTVSIADVGTPTMDGLTTLRIDKPVFGVLRIQGLKKGAKHTVNVRLLKVVPVSPDGDFPTEEEFEESEAAEHMTYQEWLNQYYGYTDVVTWNNLLGNYNAVPQEPVNMTGLSITNLQVIVTALWMGFDGKVKSESLRMAIPQCLQDLLSACGVDTDGDGIPDCWLDCNNVLLEICKKYNIPVNVYVSSCSGGVITAISADKDSSGWCGSK